jgi:hypothetical protein
MPEIVNRYATQDLFMTAETHARIADVVSRSDKDGRPFARQVDVWWAAIGIGLKIGTRTSLSGNGVKFNTAAILNTDPWRITHLELLALSQEGAAVLDNPARVIQVASEFANTGLSWLTEQLLGEAEPTLTLMNRMDEFLAVS